MEHLTQLTVLILVLVDLEALFTAFPESSYSQSEPIPMALFICSQPGFFPRINNPHQFYSCMSYPADPETFITAIHRCSKSECFDKDDESKCSLKACTKSDTKGGITKNDTTGGITKNDTKGGIAKNDTEGGIAKNDTKGDVACGKKQCPEEEEEFACLKDNLQQDAQKICEEETLTVLERLKLKMVEFTAHRGNAFKNLRMSLRDANLEMRKNYAKMVEHTGINVLPLMVATDAEPDYFGVGGVFKIYFKDGSMKRIVPVSPAFEMHKSLAHVVLGVFSIVAPYFNSPNSLNWQPPLKSFKQTIQNVQYLLQNEDTGMPPHESRVAQTIIEKTTLYIDTAIRENSAGMISYQRYANDLAPDIEHSMIRAAEVHAEDTIPALQKLKEEMGEEEWRKLHVIIPTVWPVSLFNIRLQVLEKVMSFDQIKNQVLIAEGARTEADAKKTLGRVVADRAVAQLVWAGLGEATMNDHVFSLSTRRDLLSTTATPQLNKVCQKLEEDPSKPKCPFAGRTGQTDNSLSNKYGQPDASATMLRY